MCVCPELVSHARDDGGRVPLKDARHGLAQRRREDVRRDLALRPPLRLVRVKDTPAQQLAKRLEQTRAQNTKSPEPFSSKNTLATT